MAGTLQLCDAAGDRLKLSPADFLATGGQADLYRRDGEVFKLYHDPTLTPAQAKLDELAALDARSVAVPTARVFDDTGRRAVGVRMPWVADARTLAEVVVPAFQRDHGYGVQRIADLVARLGRALASVHRAGIAVADLSDLNVLVERRGDAVHLIDADSFRTPGFPADAENPAFRDPHASVGRHDPGTDWYAFAVLGFMLFVGAHPFRGQHPRYSTLQARMRHDVSALDAEVTLPPACFSRSRIPRAWRDWLYATLQQRAREAPPQSVTGGAPGATRSIGTSTRSAAAASPVSRRLRSVLVEQLDEDVVDFELRGGVRLCRTATRCLVDGIEGVTTGPGEHVVFWSEPAGWPLLASLRAGRLAVVHALTGEPVRHHLSASAIGRFGGRLLLVGENTTFTVSARNTGSAPNAGRCVVLAVESVLRRAPDHAVRIGEDVVAVTLRDRTDLLCFDARRVTGPAVFCAQLPAASGTGTKPAPVTALRARGGWLSVLTITEHGTLMWLAHCDAPTDRAVWLGDPRPAVATLELACIASGHVVTLAETGQLACLDPASGEVIPLADARLAPGIRLRDADGRAFALNGAQVHELHYGG